LLVLYIFTENIKKKIINLIHSSKKFNLKKINISDKLKKEITRYAISFFFAYLFATLISDFPFFKSILIQSINLDTILTKISISSTAKILKLFNLQIFIDGNFLQIKNTPGVIFAYGCLGFRELSLFVFFIIFQTGSWKNKLWYIPTGISLLITLNILRATIITLGQYKYPLHFNKIHNLVSPIIMYPAIIFLWLFWLNTYSEFKKK